MQIKDLTPGEPITELTAQVMSMKPTLETNSGDMRTAVLQDKTGNVTITLWRDQCGEFKEGDIVLVTAGWCKEWKGEKEISTGKHGTITRVTDA